ncbi:MAG: carboxypeptidase-like regulatory domain-containing protein [Kofleriaceae bacterium]
MGRALFIGCLAALVACGPKTGTPGGDDDGVDSGGQAVAELVGTVWAPGMAPGQVGPGEEIPVAGALVTLLVDRPAPIPTEAYCEPCVDTTGGTLTDSRGRFSVGSSQPGTFWLVIQKGQFRLERQVTLTSGTITMADADTTLPSRSDPAAGETIPRVAVAVGNYDSVQDILGKIGLGAVDADGGFVSTASEVDVYTNGGTDLGLALGTLAQLVRDPARLRSYHIVFIPCAGTANAAALREPQVLRNLRDYVAAGGKLYVTDWSGEWMDNVWPGPIELGAAQTGGRTDTPTTAYDPATDQWDPQQFGDADGDFYEVTDGEATDPALAAWLGGQVGPRGDTGGDVGPIDPRRFAVYDNWNWIAALTPIQVGVEPGGAPVFDQPHPWVSGSGAPAAGPGKRPLTVTFHPPGCGRVLFSSYHTAPGTHRGLLPQERVLLYLILELGTCVTNPPIG